MRKSKLGGWILAAAMMVAVVPGMAQQEEGPILLPKLKPAAATLLVMCDLACNWKLDGEARGRIEAGGSAKVKIEFGQHLVAAATEDGLDKAEKELNIKASGLTLARLELASIRDVRLKAEQEARDKAKPAGATLLVMCDMACDWKLDGEAKGRIEAGGSARTKVEIGQHLVAAATEDGADQVKQLSEVKAEGQTVVSLELKPVRDTRLKARQEVSVADPNDPASPHAPGIYLATGRGADRKLIPLEACEFTPKMESKILLRVGAVANGPEARIKTSNGQPEFYFYFDEQSISRNPVTFGAANSPSDFLLLRLTVNPEAKREAIIMRPGLKRINESDPDYISFTFSTVRTNGYKVTVASSLTAGEYGFLSFSNDKVDMHSLADNAQTKVKRPLSLYDFEVPGGQ
jgi:hypothetical protein